MSEVGSQSEEGQASGMANRGNRAAGSPANPAPPAGNDGMGQLAEMLGRLLQQQGPARDQFKAPQYDGTTDVELFIQQFSDVARANQWLDGTVLLKLRASLIGNAVECGRGATVQAAFDALRARFGLTVRQARDQLGSLRKQPKSTLYEHGTLVEKLVRIAYPDMLPASQLDMVLDVFSRSLDNRYLQRHLLAVAPATIDAAVRVSEEYLQVGSGYKAGGQRLAVVDQEDKEDLTEILDKLMAMVESNAKAIAQMQKQAPPTSDWKSRPKKPIACYDCGGGHFVRDCPNKKAVQAVETEQGNEDSSC